MGTLGSLWMGDWGERCSRRWVLHISLVSARGRGEVSVLYQRMKRNPHSLSSFAISPKEIWACITSLVWNPGLIFRMLMYNIALLISPWNQQRWLFRHIGRDLWCKRGKSFKNYVLCVIHPYTQLTVQCSQRWSSLKRKETLQNTVCMCKIS